MAVWVFGSPWMKWSKSLLGSQGSVLKSIEGIRLRGDLSISPIDLQVYAEALGSGPGHQAAWRGWKGTGLMPVTRTEVLADRMQCEWFRFAKRAAKAVADGIADRVERVHVDSQLTADQGAVRTQQEMRFEHAVLKRPFAKRAPGHGREVRDIVPADIDRLTPLAIQSPSSRSRLPRRTVSTATVDRIPRWRTKGETWYPALCMARRPAPEEFCATTQYSTDRSAPKN